MPKPTRPYQVYIPFEYRLNSMVFFVSTIPSLIIKSGPPVKF